jgi:hypothetical protein
VSSSALQNPLQERADDKKLTVGRCGSSLRLEEGVDDKIESAQSPSTKIAAASLSGKGMAPANRVATGYGM